MNALVLSNINLSYNKQQSILKDCNLRIVENQKVLLTGKSGMGKSSLLHLVSGCIPTHIKAEVSGELMLYDKPIDDYSLNDRIQTINILFQQPHWQFVSLTVLDELAFGLSSLNVSREHMLNQIKEIVQELHLQECANKRLSECSLGQQQVIATASILLLKPKILCLDEALSALESNWKKHVMDVIFKRVSTCLIVDHQPQIESFTHRVILENGVLRDV